MNAVKCDICETDSGFLTDNDKTQEVKNFEGVYFYNAICWTCWNTEKESI